MTQITLMVYINLFSILAWAKESVLYQATYAHQVGPTILDHFAEYFNQSYPLPKLDQIAVAGFPAGAMENWGLVTYGLVENRVVHCACSCPSFCFPKLCLHLA